MQRYVNNGKLIFYMKIRMKFRKRKEGVNI